MTVAPKDDLILIPQDQTAKPIQTTTEVNNNPSSDFLPPSGWGAATQAPKIDIPEYPEEDVHQKEKTETGLVKFVKIFLISVALILLGVLMGVLASSFFEGNSAPNNIQTPVPTPSEVDNYLPPVLPSTQSGQIDNMMELDFTKKIEFRNPGTGAYSFDLSLTDEWKIASKSTDKNDLNIVLSSQNLLANIFFNPKSKTPKSEICLQPEEIAPKNIPYLKYSQYKEIMVGSLNWRLIKNSQATESANYLICEQNTNNQFVSLTSIGFINISKEGSLEMEPAEENKVVSLFKGLNIITSTPSSALKK